MTAFYVDARAGNDNWAGDQSKPLKTIQKAVAKAMPGDAVFVVPGTYSGTVKLPRSGTAAKPIPIRSVARHGAVLKGMFEIKGQSFLHFTGFRVQGGNYGFRVEGQSQGIVIGGNYIYDTNSSGVSAWGVPWQAQPSTYGWRGVRDITVTDNVFDHCCDGGYNEIASFANGVDGVIFTDNTIKNPGSTANGGEGPDFKCGVKNVKYLRNKHIGLRKVATYVDGGCPENGRYKDPWNGVNQNIEIAFNEYLNCGAGINVSTEAAGSCVDVSIHDNWIEGGSKHGVLFYEHPKRKEWAPKTWQHSHMERLIAQRNAVIGKPLGFVVNCGIGIGMRVEGNKPYQVKTPYQLLAGQVVCDRAVAKTRPVR